MTKSKRKYILLFFTGLFGALDISIHASVYAAEVGTFGVSLAFGAMVGCVVWAGYEMWLGFSSTEADYV